MMTRRYLALLRGINVGGKNIIRMTALRACFEKMGFSDVLTYIQSGNVVFKTAIANQAALEHRIEQALAKQFNYASRVVIISHDTLKRVTKQAPPGFGKIPATYRYDVIFLKTPLTPREAMKAVEVKEGVDRVSGGAHALYFSRLISKATQSRMSKIVPKPEYQYMTIRNWNTTIQLLALMEGATQAIRGPRAQR